MAEYRALLQCETFKKIEEKKTDYDIGICILWTLNIITLILQYFLLFIIIRLIESEFSSKLKKKSKYYPYYQQNLDKCLMWVKALQTRQVDAEMVKQDEIRISVTFIHI